MVMGSCLCGEVAFEAELFDAMVHCHCSICRKQHGSAFATFVTTPRQAFRWVSGQDRTARYDSSPDGYRNFCSTCGSPVPCVDGDAPHAHIPAGMLDDDPGLKLRSIGSSGRSSIAIRLPTSCPGSRPHRRQ